jgi:hypothetical protein
VLCPPALLSQYVSLGETCTTATHFEINDAAKRRGKEKDRPSNLTLLDPDSLARLDDFRRRRHLTTKRSPAAALAACD